MFFCVFHWREYCAGKLIYSKDIFTNVHQPWTWIHTSVVPGGVLMSMCVAAAIRTVPDTFALASLQTNFVSGPKPDVAFIYKVKRVSEGKRFVVRIVNVEQNEKVTTTVTLSFVNGTSWTGPAMQYSTRRAVNGIPRDVERDDLQAGHTRFGPWMKFQRLPVLLNELDPPESKVAPAIARISSPMSSPPGSLLHVLGIINLSDYHVLDCLLLCQASPTGSRK